MDGNADEASFADRCFLLNFIMGTYLGPDVYSDNPRRSAFQRAAERLPPYTPKNLGFSFLSISQLQSLYYYILRNAHYALAFKPHLLYAYLKGNLTMPSSWPAEDCWQFTSFFPLEIHDHKRYSSSNEVIKGIVLIDDPITSYMKKDDLERFRYLSGLNTLKIDVNRCLSYQHGYPRGREETEPNCIAISEEGIAGTFDIAKEVQSTMFKGKKKRSSHRNPLSLPALPFRVFMSQQNEKSTSKRSCEFEAFTTMPRITLPPKSEEFILDESIVLTGTAREIVGPPVGAVDIGVSEAAYLFQVALPGVQRDFSQFSCEIECNGKVHIQGSTTGGKTVKKRSRVFHMKFQRLCPPGPFTVSFNLPGPVDPRLFTANFRDDGVFEAVVARYK